MLFFNNILKSIRNRSGFLFVTSKEVEKISRGASKATVTPYYLSLHLVKRAFNIFIVDEVIPTKVDFATPKGTYSLYLLVNLDVMKKDMKFGFRDVFLILELMGKKKYIELIKSDKYTLMNKLYKAMITTPKRYHKLNDMILQKLIIDKQENMILYPPSSYSIELDRYGIYPFVDRNTGKVVSIGYKFVRKVGDSYVRVTAISKYPILTEKLPTLNIASRVRSKDDSVLTIQSFPFPLGNIDNMKWLVKYINSYTFYDVYSKVKTDNSIIRSFIGTALYLKADIIKRARYINKAHAFTYLNSLTNLIRLLPIHMGKLNENQRYKSLFIDRPKDLFEFIIKNTWHNMLGILRYAFDAVIPALVFATNIKYDVYVDADSFIIGPDVQDYIIVIPLALWRDIKSGRYLYSNKKAIAYDSADNKLYIIDAPTYYVFFNVFTTAHYISYIELNGVDSCQKCSKIDVERRRYADRIMNELRLMLKFGAKIGEYSVFDYDWRIVEALEEKFDIFRYAYIGKGKLTGLKIYGGYTLPGVDISYTYPLEKHKKLYKKFGVKFMSYYLYDLFDKEKIGQIDIMGSDLAYAILMTNLPISSWNTPVVDLYRGDILPEDGVEAILLARDLDRTFIEAFTTY